MKDNLYRKESENSMSSGSYFTIYRKHKDIIVPANKLDKIKEEYKKSDESLFKRTNEETSSNDIDVPVLMHESFTASPYDDAERNYNYYDKDGHLHERLLEFHFGSSFTILKEHFRLNAYRFSESAVLISKNEAEKMLQAVNYILNGNYSKSFEDVLNNEYVEILGDGYSPFDDRFKKSRENIYIDKHDESYTVTFGDTQWDREIAETDSDIVFSLKRVRSCLQAFLDAESYEWESTSLVLEYSAC